MGILKHLGRISDDLLMRLDFRDSTPEVIDLSPIGGVVSTLQEGKIECLVADKVFLPYFKCELNGNIVFLPGCLSLLLSSSIPWEISSFSIVY